MKLLLKKGVLKWSFPFLHYRKVFECVVRLLYVCMLLVEIYQKCVQLFRSSRPEVFCKKDVLRNFTKFTGIHLCQSLFLNKVKKRIWHRCFPVNFAKFLRAIFLTEHLRWTLSCWRYIFSRNFQILKGHYIVGLTFKWKWNIGML